MLRIMLGQELHELKGETQCGADLPLALRQLGYVGSTTDYVDPGLLRCVNEIALGTHFPRRFPSLSHGSKWCLGGGMQFWAKHHWMIGHLWPSFFSLMGDLGMMTEFVDRIESWSQSCVSREL